MTARVLYTKPSITKLEIDYATDAAANGWGSECYSYITKFEKLFRDHLGVKYAIATSSCTGALHMGLSALNVGIGDEVILADTNWIASAAPITYLGATPVFVDIKSDTWCLDPQLVRNAITDRTKAILAVHLYGNLSDMDELMAISREFDIPIVEDSAEAIGSQYGSKCAGSIGEFGTFSFHGTKTLTTGEGGMFVTNSDSLYEKVLMASNHGRAPSQLKQFWPDAVGFKYKMSNIQAAIGCAQIERVDELVKRKREIFKYYEEKFSGIEFIKMNPELGNSKNGFWMPTLVFDRSCGINREILQSEFEKANIDARVFFWPLSSLDFFESQSQNVNSYDIPERAINLPSYHDISPSDLNRVAAVVETLAKSQI